MLVGVAWGFDNLQLSPLFQKYVHDAMETNRRWRSETANRGNRNVANDKFGKAGAARADDT